MIMSCLRPTKYFLLFILFASTFLLTHSQDTKRELDLCNITWTSQSKNASESMPCGGGDIGLNVWVENNELLIYVARSGSFDETNALLKMGRIRVRLSPNPFEGDIFRQQLLLRDGQVSIAAANGKLKTNIKVWVDVFSPTVHVNI